MKVRELIEWLKTQDLDADVEVVRSTLSGGDGTWGPCFKVPFDGEWWCYYYNPPSKNRAGTLLLGDVE